jgi:hypothetical protein
MSCSRRAALFIIAASISACDAPTSPDQPGIRQRAAALDRSAFRHNSKSAHARGEADFVTLSHDDSAFAGYFIEGGKFILNVSDNNMRGA